MSKNSILLAVAGMALAGVALAQTANPTLEASRAVRAEEMALVGVTALRPCVSPLNPPAGECEAANFDEAKANPWPLPDPLVFADGTRVTTKAQWRKRRAELLEIFDREIFGRIPAHTPKVSWRVDETLHENFNGVPVVTQKLTGHVDNSADPAITVDIKVNISVPESAKGKHVPAVMALAFLRPFILPDGRTFPADPHPDWKDQTVAKGWAAIAYDNTSTQPDNGAGLHAGIIGLVNRGGPRKPDDWGALQAWGWGASRFLDYLETDSDIDARRVAIMGHSRNGKAALVMMAHDPRFAIGFISSSGAGGAAPYRRYYGETIASIENPTLFHWMAPNFLKYAAVGKTANDVPVDTDELIALCAPRPLFLGGGVEQPDAPSNKIGDLWVDPVGSFKAEVAAGPVYVLLGAKGIAADTPAPTPSVLVDSGELAFRRHDQGHTPNPNWPYFLAYAQRYFKS